MFVTTPGKAGAGEYGQEVTICSLLLLDWLRLLPSPLLELSLFSFFKTNGFAELSIDYLWQQSIERLLLAIDISKHHIRAGIVV